MSKGLKQMVDEAIAATDSTGATRSTKKAGKTKPPPVEVSSQAQYALAQKVREWAGWPDGVVVPGDPSVYGSPWAMTDQVTHTITYNPDTLVINPNRVLLTVTPFRLRQEAVLTGALLHEAGHARHSNWMPRTKAESEAKPLRHSTYLNGTDEPTDQCIKLAVLMEESRIEGLMLRDANQIGAATLGWTMRAMAAHTMGTTALSAQPNQQIMDLIDSWAKRAGRQYAVDAWSTGYRMRNWVQDFTTLLTNSIVAHLEARVEKGALDCEPLNHARKVVNTLIAMTTVTDDTGPTMIDMARLVLGWLFPETPGETEDEQATPSGAACGMAAEPDDSESESGEGGESDEAGEQGEGNTEPEDEGEGDDPGAGSTGDEAAEDEAGEPDSPEEGESEGEGESDSESDGEPESEDDSEGATGSTGDDSEVDTESPLAEALADMEREADGQAAKQAEEEGEDEEEAEVSGNGAGSGASGGMGGGYRNPTKDERDLQKGAEKFLRGLIDPGQSSKVSLTDTPSSTIDGAAMAAWKAGGQRSDPRFFVRTRREVVPSMPVKIAILVDVSSSMDALQKPSSVLSWALSAAAMDLRNFAGRGQQVESCLIHWGSSARVIQRNGETLPGIKEHACTQGTSVMHKALELVEAEMPGFFDMPATPVHRLLVQFTDWELFGRNDCVPWIDRALASGVNMLTVAPSTYSERAGMWGSDLPAILRQCKTQRGRTSLLRYNWTRPSEVWEQAAEALVV